ncbi:hypothetical protein [Viridibacterium curvum]|uniref:GNAT family N-acetyltransferase n=1 Tax=Viridibacterium curvum TaxID=1101404 RepID=A0ABP9QHC7_9RHOO
MAYHFSTTPPETSGTKPPTLPSRSRLSAPPLRTGHAASRPGLVEFLRGLGDEQTTLTAAGKLRSGLAVTPWQRQQAQILLNTERPQMNRSAVRDDDAAQVALVLDTSLHKPCCGALGAWRVRRDGLTSLRQYDGFLRAAEHLETAGHVVADIDAQALCRQFEQPASLLPLLLSAIAPTLHGWGATLLTVSCAHADAMLFRSELGFETVKHQQPGEGLLLQRELAELYACLGLPTADIDTAAVALRA